MRKPKNEYTIAVGKQVVIWVDGMRSMSIAEVTKVEPLSLKIMESGPFANLKEDDYTLLVQETIAWQADGAGHNMILEMHKRIGRPVLSGLRSLGITDNELHELLPYPVSDASTKPK